jgi:hypothetical protein
VTGARWWYHESPFFGLERYAGQWQRWFEGLRIWQPLLATEPGPLDAEENA